MWYKMKMMSWTGGRRFTGIVVTTTLTMAAASYQKMVLCEKSPSATSGGLSASVQTKNNEDVPIVESGVPMRVQMENYLKKKQQEIVEALEKSDSDGENQFQVDRWTRPGGGGGISCVIQKSKVFEKGGVNFSAVYGTLPPAAVSKMRADHKSMVDNSAGGDKASPHLPFYACGLSMVLHPKNPHAPTVHLNYRYFETEHLDGTPSAWWFGGGCDLTPSYLYPEDAKHFHRTIKGACDKNDPTYYPKFKKWCDEYFYVKHRGECRGIGGIFFDDLDDKPPQELFQFAKDCLDSFLPSYIPILERRKNMPFTEEEKRWQQLRRGRYVEFNLVHDRGTQFGLQTPGSRVESILMSLPLTASWEYQHHPEPGSREQELLDVLENPVEWV